VQKHSASGGLTHNNSTGNLETYKMNNSERQPIEPMGNSTIITNAVGPQKLFSSKQQTGGNVLNSTNPTSGTGRPMSPKGSNGSNQGNTSSSNQQASTNNKLIANIQYNQKISQAQQISPKGVGSVQKPAENMTGYGGGFTGNLNRLKNFILKNFFLGRIREILLFNFKVNFFNFYS
jgi:hypothetical protein